MENSLPDPARNA